MKKIFVLVLTFTIIISLNFICSKKKKTNLIKKEIVKISSSSSDLELKKRNDKFQNAINILNKYGINEIKNENITTENNNPIYIDLQNYKYIENKIADINNLDIKNTLEVGLNLINKRFLIGSTNHNDKYFIVDLISKSIKYSNKNKTFKIINSVKEIISTANEKFHISKKYNNLILHDSLSTLLIKDSKNKFKEISYDIQQYKINSFKIIDKKNNIIALFYDNTSSIIYDLKKHRFRKFDDQNNEIFYSYITSEDSFIVNKNDDLYLTDGFNGKLKKQLLKNISNIEYLKEEDSYLITTNNQLLIYKNNYFNKLIYNDKYLINSYFYFKPERAMYFNISNDFSADVVDNNPQHLKFHFVDNSIQNLSDIYDFKYLPKSNCIIYIKKDGIYLKDDNLKIKKLFSLDNYKYYSNLSRYIVKTCNLDFPILVNVFNKDEFKYNLYLIVDKKSKPVFITKSCPFFYFKNNYIIYSKYINGSESEIDKYSCININPESDVNSNVSVFISDFKGNSTKICNDALLYDNYLSTSDLKTFFTLRRSKVNSKILSIYRHSLQSF